MNGLSRRGWYLAANALVGAWFVAAGVTLAFTMAGAGSAWLATHVLLLGGVTSAILVWSQHFADTVLRRAGSRTALAVRLAVHTLGAVIVLVGVSTGAWPVTLAGGVLVSVAVCWHGADLARRLRRALPARFAPLVRYYVAAAAALLVGVALGVIMASEDVPAGIQARLMVAHVVVNVLGWVGFTVVGTVILLWPTVLHARIGQATDRAARVALPTLGAGILLGLAGCVVGLPTLLVTGIAVYVAGLVVTGIDLVRQARQAPPTSYAGMGMGCALLWLLGCVVALGARIAFASSWLEVEAAIWSLLVPFAVGFAAQLVTAALSYLLPVVFGGGPARVRAMNREFDRLAAFRAIVLNAALLLWLSPAVPLRGAFLAIACVAVAAPLALATRALFVARAAAAGSPPDGGVPPRGRRPGDAASGGARPGDGAGSPPRSGRSGAVMAAFGVIVLVAAIGVGVENATKLPATTAMAAPETTTVHVTMKNMRFSPAEVRVPRGNRLKIVLSNADDMVHDLTLATGVTSGRLVKGETTTLDAGVITASVAGWCSITGHRQLGMVFSIVAMAGMPGMHSGTGPKASSSQSATADLDLAKAPPKDFRAHDPALPPRTGATHTLTLTVRDTETEVAPGVRQTLWTYNGTAPGPTLHGAVGDTFDITLVNDGTMGHSIDFHAGALAPNEPMRTIAPGERLTYRFTATRAGAWLYHCSTMPMAAHIANGMFGAVIIDPPGLAPVDTELVLVQNEYYLGAQNGIVDAAKLAAQTPDLVTFNGYANQYRDRPVDVRAGKRVRIWVVDAGPNKPSAFHVVGAQFDTVYSEGDYLLKGGGSTGAGGAQALALQPGQGGFVELTFPEPGDYPFVTHVMSDAEKGATGTFHVTR